MAQSEQVCPIVDDVEFDRRMMRRMIRKNGPHMPMFVARNFDVARRRLREREDSILFLDNALPDGRGVDFVSELSADRDLLRIPVVIVSDFPSPVMYAKARAANPFEVWSRREFVGSRSHA